MVRRSKNEIVTLNGINYDLYLFNLTNVSLSFCRAHTYLVPLTQTMKAEVRKGERYEYDKQSKSSSKVSQIGHGLSWSEHHL